MSPAHWEAARHFESACRSADPEHRGSRQRSTASLNGQGVAMMAELTTMELRDLSSLSQHLNTVTDELNTALKDIETRLNKLSLGVEA